MSQSVSEFWFGVREERDIIFAALKESKEQPKDAVLDKQMCRTKACTSGFYLGWCYITSIRNRDRGTLEGDICEANINLAGQRIAEGTHRLATDEEIKKHKADHAKRAVELKRTINEEIRRRTGQRQVDPAEQAVTK